MTSYRYGNNGVFPPCKAEGCVDTIEGGTKGFCRKHYMSVVRTGTFDSETGKRLKVPNGGVRPATSARKNCSVQGCMFISAAKGLCNGHWQRQHAGRPLDTPLQKRVPKTVPKPCNIEGCARRAQAVGVCAYHYQRIQDGIEPNAPPLRLTYLEGARCVVSGCKGKPRSRNLCAAHQQQRRAGIVDENGNTIRELKSFKRPRKKDKWVGQHGYALVQAPSGHPGARMDGSILEHRLVVEQQLGRYLEPHELVHHKNGIRTDNRPENLELLDGRARHGEGHPPGHRQSPEEIQRALDTLRVSDPAAYGSLLAKMAEEYEAKIKSLAEMLQPPSDDIR